MELIHRIHALTNFLSRFESDEDQLCRFLVLDSFRDLRTVSAVLARLEHDGTFKVVGTFGLNPVAVEIFAGISLSNDSMISESVRSNRVRCNGTFKELEAQQLNIRSTNSLRNAPQMISVPIIDYGVVLLFLSKSREVDSTLELFLIAIGSMIALDQKRSVAEVIAVVAPKIVELVVETLTIRQLTIVEGMKRGSTNAGIALDLGFSESLIRQETIDIFRKLHVSGRKELIAADRAGRGSAPLHPLDSLSS